jgi:hypothetical protein
MLFKIENLWKIKYNTEIDIQFISIYCFYGEIFREISITLFNFKLTIEWENKDNV